MKKSYCLCCGAATLENILNLGKQAPSNLFLSSPIEEYDTHDLVLCRCSACGIAQLKNPMPISMVSCRHSWLTYNEPETHLDTLTEKLTALLPHAKARIAGLSYKDASLLELMHSKGDVKIIDISMHTMGLNEGEKRIEKIQERVNSKFAQALIKKSGKLDMLIVRHMLEHSHSPRNFISACVQMVKEDGLIIFEIPGCEKIFQSHEHCFIWEEHILYFTKHSIQSFFQLLGHEIISVDNYPYPMEDSIVVVVKNSLSTQKTILNPAFDMQLLHDFGASFTKSICFLTEYFQQITSGGEKIAMFGASHLAMKFINFYGLVNYISIVIDDHPHKNGLFLPDSGLEIVNSKFLEDEIPKLCLLSLNPESEKKVIATKSKYLEYGGKFLSIFSRNKSNIYNDKR